MPNKIVPLASPIVEIGTKHGQKFALVIPHIHFLNIRTDYLSVAYGATNGELTIMAKDLDDINATVEHIIDAVRTFYSMNNEGEAQ